MAWHSTSPDITKSVKQNGTIIGDNTAYTEVSMQKDHHWGSGDTIAGRHQFVQTPKSEAGGIPSDPALGSSMDLVYYSKEKTAVESPDNQDVQPYAQNAGGIMQLLGIRAMGVFSATAGVITTQYTHNVTSIAFQGVGTTGKFQVIFPELPSNNYAVLGGGVFNGGTEDFLHFQVQGTAGGVLNNSKSTTRLNFRTYVLTGGVAGLVNPIQCWFIAFGG